MATSTNYTQLGYIEEVISGETPATPTFELLPTTGGSPVSNITTAVSEVIRADRQTDDLTVVDSSISGDLNYELSYAPYKPFIEALMQNTASAPVSEAGCSVDGVDFTVISKTSIHTILEVGDVFKVTSILDSTIDGVYTCVDNTTTVDEVVIYPAMPDTMTAQSDILISITTTIVNGAEVPKSYTIRKSAVEGGSSYYWYYRGCKINTMNFNFATGSILNGSMGVIGLTEEARTTVLTGETADDPVPEYTIMNSVNSIGTIYLQDDLGAPLTLGTCSFSSLDLTVDNQINEAKSIGVLGACDTAAFSVQITGAVEVYFKNLDLYNKFLNSESFAVTIILEDGIVDTEGLGESIGINLPKCKFETLDTPINGKDEFLMQSGSLRALRDVTGDYMVKFSFID